MRIVIDGAGEIGSHIAKMLAHEGADVRVLDSDEHRLETLGAYADVDVIEGEPTSLGALGRAGVEDADLFVSVVPHVPQEINTMAAILAKRMGAAKTMARVDDVSLTSGEGLKLLNDSGVDLAFCPSKIAAAEICDQLRHGNSTETLDFSGGKLIIEAFRLTESSPLLDVKLVEFVQGVSREEKEEFRIIAIARNSETIIPRFDTKFHFSDVVYTISTSEGAKMLETRIGVHGLEVEDVMILGGGEVGSKLAAGLSQGMRHVKLIESDHGRCVELSEALPSSVMVVEGDGRNPDFLYEESIRDYDAFVAVTGGDEANILACVAAKRFGVPRTIAEVENIEYMHLAEEMGVDTVINKKLLTAGRVFKFTLGDKARFVRYMNGIDAEVMEYEVREKSAVTKAPLKDLPFPSDAVVGGVIRGEQAIIAVGDTLIRPGDHVCVFAMPSAVSAVDKFFK